MKQLWNGGWTFLKTSTGTTLEQVVEHLGEFVQVDLPHDWLIYDTHNLYEDSVGWYRKQFLWQEVDKRATIIFDGIYMDSTVYINRQKAGEWKYGYSAFVLDITSYLQEGENEILVSVDFRSPNSRWYSGAGIYRDVWFKTTELIYIEENDIYVSTKKQGKDFELTVEAWIHGCECLQGEKPVIQNKLYDANGHEINFAMLSEESECRDRTKWHRTVLMIEHPILWDVDNPYLYRLRTDLLLNGEVIQTESQRIGFRETKFDSKEGFFLNGRKLKLNGVCEHHDLGALGAVFNKAAMRRKFRILKEMGVNAVRGAHNMMAQGFVELADEMGVLLISEAFDMWERPKNPYDYARFFKEWHEKDVESWVKRDRNHPSVIMWSIGNEIYDTHADEHGQEITVDLKTLVEKYDSAGNAKSTIGSNYMPWENAQNCADIVKLAGYNYSEKYYREHHEKHPDWVIYGSETSSIVQSRGVYHFPLKAGILADDDLQCSALGNSATSWGAKSMEDCVTIDRDMEFSMGQFLWTGFDYIGEPTPYHTKNSYFGQVDTAGFAKDSYYVWKSAWTDYKVSPMIHVFPYWDFNEGQLIDVRVCSNAPTVELFLNGKSLGKQELTHAPGSGKHIIADYQVPYEEGELVAVAYDEYGTEIVREVKCSFGNSSKIVLSVENENPVADGRDILFVTIETVDASGNLVENACDRVKVEVTGAGRLVGLDNGDSTDYDSYKGVSRRLFNGKLLAMVQTNLTPGEITVTVSGKGLETAQIQVLSRACEKNSDVATACENLQSMCDLKGGTCITTLEENQSVPVSTGSEDEIPVRKVLLKALEGQHFSPEKRELTVRAQIEPVNATDTALVFKAVNDMGVPSNLVVLTQEGNQVKMKALGDGMFRLRCMSDSGTDDVRLISQLEFTIEGLGQAYHNPYDFISGSLYSSVIGEAGNGNERGVATARDGVTVVTYSDIDFGNVGSDEITVPIFALTSEEYPIEIWEGIPGEEGCELLADVVYQKPMIWNVYQPETWKLSKRLKGIGTISFRVNKKIHIKGFSFTEYKKAWMRLYAGEADAVYGDSFQRVGSAVEGIGNNVSLVFTDMDFGEEAARRIVIKGRTPQGKNTIHVRFFNGQEESKQIVEFAGSNEYEEQSFAIEPMRGKWEVTFVFLPGSCFDFAWFQFEK